MGRYPLRFWLTVASLVGVFIGLMGAWATVIFVSVSGFDTDDGKLMAFCAGVGAVFLFVHTAQTDREKRPRWPLVILFLMSLAISAIALYDRSDVQRNLSRTSLGEIGKVGWGLWLDVIAGIALAISSFVLLIRCNEPYGKRLVATGPGSYTQMPPQPPSVLPPQQPEAPPTRAQQPAGPSTPPGD
jgi:hypothetical protein